MYGLCFEGQWRWTYHLLLIIWLLLLAATPPKALGYFLGDTKAVLHGCEDHWTLQDRTSMPLLFQMTVCVDIRVTVPGSWVAFSYSSVHAPRPELGLEGDDKAVYGWLLRVRHRFPVELSPTVWHRVCLRRDVPRNSFSLEVDGKMVAARTVIAQAISPSGSLWLGCRPRDRPPGASLGEVELYMFRMWNDLDHHGVCEDGTVIGWSAQYWGLTSPRARQRDPNLLCDHRRLRRMAQGGNAAATAGPRAFTTPPVPSTKTTSSPVIVVTHVSNQTSQVTGPQLINCDIRQFCSQKNAYFWMSIHVEVKEGDKNEQDVQNLVSAAFGCSGNTASDKMDFCLAVEVNCVAKSQISTTTCDVLLQRSVAVSACEVQWEGVSALQIVGGEQIEVKITREVERVGRYHCEDTAPSSGGFVRCASTSSLEDICQANKASTVACSLIEPDSYPDLQPVSKSCSRRGPHFCDCTAFCESQRHFFATRINITSDAVNVDLLKSLLSRPRLAQSCGTRSNCQDSYEKVHLECHGTQLRLFSCMVILEMSGSVDICSLNESLQELIDSNADITNDRPLTRMMICGPDLSVDTLLKSNLTWVDSDLLTSDMCQPDLLECEENEVRAVLLDESCPHTTWQTTTQPSTLTMTSITATPVTTATEHTNTEAGKTNASRSTVQPNMTTPPAEITSTQSSTQEPVLQTSSQNTTSSSVNSTLQITTTALIDSTLNTTTLSPNHITVYHETTANTLRPSPNETSTTTSNSTIGTFTPSPTLVNNVTTTTKNNTTASNKLTKAYNVTTAHNNWNLHNGTTTSSNTTVDTFAASPNHTADYNVTTINVKQHNSAVTTNTTISTFTSSPNYTITTTTRNYTTASKHDTTEFNKTTVDQQNVTTSTSNATIITSTTSPKHTVVYAGTTASNNYTTDYNNGSITTFSTFTPSPSYNVTTATKKHTTDSNNYTTVYNVTTASNNYTTQYNVSTADRNPQKGTNTTSNTTVYTAGYNVTTTTSYAKQHNSTVTATNTTMSTFTSSPNYTTVNNVTTATKNYTTVDNITTVDNNGNQQNGTTTTSNTTISTFTTPNPTVVYNVTTSASNNTTEYNVTTPSNNYTTDYNAMTADNNNRTSTTSKATISTSTSSPNYTMAINVTTTTKNYTTHFNNYTTQYNIRNLQNGTTTSNTTISTFTTPNPTVVYNVTTSASNNTTEYNVTTPSNNYTTQYNVTTPSNNYTTQYNGSTANIRNLQNGTTTSNTTISTFTTPNPTVVYHVTTSASNNTTKYNVTTPSNNYTTQYNVTTPSNNYTTQYNGSTANIRNLQSGTTTSNTTISTFTTPNPTVVYNVTTSASNNTTEYNVTTPSNNYTTDYNVMTADNNNRTNTTSNATISTSTSSPNYTMANNVTTTTKNYTTHFNNYTTQYNGSTANIRNLQSGTTTSNTTISTFTTPIPTVVYNVTTSASNNTTEYNVTTPSNNYTTDYNAITADNNNRTNTTSNATISTSTSSPNYTMANNVTTAIKNYTTAFNNYTTVDNNGKEQNTTNTSNTTISTYTTSVYNATTAASNYTTQYNVTASNSNTTEYNVTTADNIRNLQNGTTTTSNTTFSTFTPSSNHTADYNLTTTSSHVKQHNSTVTTTSTTMSTFTTPLNNTMVGKITTATKNYTTALNNYTTVYNTTADNNNGTITTSNTTISTFTPSPSLSYTTVNNVTTVSHKYTTAENVTTKTVSQNKRTTYNVTTATPHRNMTTSTAETLAATSKNSTVDNVTAVVDNTTKSAVAPLNNQTANHTTARVTYTKTTSKNDTSSTTAANGSIDHNETAGTGLNLSTTASSLTTDLNLTSKRPVISLTTMVASTKRGPPSTTTTTTTGTTATTTTTTTTTIASTSTTITKPDTGVTSTTTAKTTQSQEAREEEANELLVQTQNVSLLNSSQVAQLTGQLEKLLDGPTVSQAVGQKAVNIISNLMEGDALALAASANRLIRVVDDLGLKLVVTGDKEIVSSSSLVLAVKTVDGINFPTTSVDILNTDNVQFSDISRSPALGSVYLPSSLTTGLRPEEQQQASRVQFTYFTKSTLFQDATLDNQTSVSPILGSSVANLSISNLSENISYTIRNINFPQKNYTASCVFWNFSLHDGLGGWSSNGCSVVNTTSEETTCSCNHLTSFAILLDLSRDGLQDRQQVQILTFITYIGCGLSAVFLAVTLLTYLSFEKLLRDIPAKILVQLCISLLLLNLLFLLDGWLAIYPATGLCISTAFFLHYFLLTSFTWAGLEALHMYLSVIRVFTPYLSRYMLKFSLMGWGIPLIVVIVVISVDKDNYGLVTYGKYTDGTTDDFCWLRNNIAFYVAVVGYFVLIFALCLLVFIMVMVQLARIKRQNPQNQSPNRGVMTDMRSIAGLVILLGLTWGFALFAWGPLYLPFVYLFTIFNTLQGFLVFVFHCAVKENVRRQWRTYLCCGRLRLAENSEWSRTATQNTKNISGATVTASAPRLPSRTSSVISDGTNSNSSLFLDSGISDCTGSDVVLNEIHRQNMSP